VDPKAVFRIICLPQVGGELDEVGFDDPLGNEVANGQQRERRMEKVLR
jgi:hypothetical protein